MMPWALPLPSLCADLALLAASGGRRNDGCVCEKFAKNKFEKYCNTFRLYVVNIVLPQIN